MQLVQHWCWLPAGGGSPENVEQASESLNTSPADSDEEGQASVSSDTDSADNSGEKEPIVLRFNWWGSEARHEYTQKLLDMYTEQIGRASCRERV